MNEPMKRRRLQLVIVSAALAVAVGLIALTLFRYTHRKVLRAEQRKVETVLKTSWQNHTFIPTENYDAICAALRSSEGFSKLIRENPTGARLAETIGSFLYAYSQGDPTHYSLFRFPIEPTLANSGWDGTGMGFYSRVIAELGIDFGETSFATSNRMVMQTLFERHRSLTNTAPGAFSSRLITSFAPDATRVEIQEYPIPGPSVSEWAWEDGGLNLTMPAPTVVYRFDEKADARGTVPIARVRVLIGSTLATKAFPIYLQFFWHADAERFVPTELNIPLGPLELPDLVF